MLVYCLYQRKFTFAAIVEVAFSQPLLGLVHMFVYESFTSHTQVRYFRSRFTESSLNVIIGLFHFVYIWQRRDGEKCR